MEVVLFSDLRRDFPELTREKSEEGSPGRCARREGALKPRDVLDLIEAVPLGVLQGLTEFLQISSSRHRLLAQHFLGLDQEGFGLPFDSGHAVGAARPG